MLRKPVGMTFRDRGFLAELRKKVAVFIQGTET
jgi:hypothetical protein